MKSPEEIKAAESVLHFICDNYKGSVVMEKGLLTSEETTFQPGERVRVIETTGVVVENLWGISSKTMMVEVQFNGTTSVFAQDELAHIDEDPPISISLDDLSSVFADSINALSNECHQISAEHGFWSESEERTSRQFMLARMALIHSEVSECLEELRAEDVNWRSVFEELADICIRVFDFAGGYSDRIDGNLDLGNAIIQKMKKNRSRPFMHGKRA